jgi:hypothetical protein
MIPSSSTRTYRSECQTIHGREATVAKRYVVLVERLHGERRLEGKDCHSANHKRRLAAIARRVARVKRAAQKKP